MEILKFTKLVSCMNFRTLNKALIQGVGLSTDKDIVNTMSIHSFQSMLADSFQYSIVLVTFRSFHSFIFFKVFMTDFFLFAR